MMRPGEAAAARLTVARALDVDRVTGEVVSAFGAAGVRAILLKGPGLALWLYDGAARPYVDSDLLVAPADLDAAGRVLIGLGFEPQPVNCHHARAWARRPAGGTVDLHSHVPGVHLSPAEVWREISDLTETIGVGGTEVEVPRVALRALITALHAAHHGPEVAKPLVDLGRALERASEDIWREATEIAYRLEAVAAFSHGLRLLPEGARLAERLGLPSAELVDAVRTPGTRTPLVLGLERLAARRGVRGKVRLLGAEAFPSPDFMRWKFPLARRGLVGLALAYPARIGWLLWHLVPSVRAWHRDRRA